MVYRLLIGFRGKQICFSSLSASSCMYQVMPVYAPAVSREREFSGDFTLPECRRCRFRIFWLTYLFSEIKLKSHKLILIAIVATDAPKIIFLYNLQNFSHFCYHFVTICYHLLPKLALLFHPYSNSLSINFSASRERTAISNISLKRQL